MEHLVLLVILPLLAMASMIPCNAVQEHPIYSTDGDEVTSNSSPTTTSYRRTAASATASTSCL